MNYELAKELKDAGTFYELKQCQDCERPYIGGHHSIRCADCRVITRRARNSGWQKKYYEENRRRILWRHVAYQNHRRATDPIYRENELTKGHTRRARIEGNGGSHTTDEWLALVEQHDKRCARCLEQKPLTRDHIVPISRGGTNDITNIQPLCSSCNSSKGAHI